MSLHPPSRLPTGSQTKGLDLFRLRLGSEKPIPGCVCHTRQGGQLEPLRASAFSEDGAPPHGQSQSTTSPLGRSWTCLEPDPVSSPASMIHPHMRACSHSGLCRSSVVSTSGQSRSTSRSEAMAGVTGTQLITSRYERDRTNLRPPLPADQKQHSTRIRHLGGRAKV